jgi:uracil permease
MIVSSSFAFLPALFATVNDTSTRSGAIIVAGLFYAVVSLIVSRAGLKWLDKIFPPVVIGSVIITIGMGLAPTAVKGALFDGAGAYHIEYLVIALFTIGVISLVGTIAKGFFRAIPLFSGLIAGYIFTLAMGAIFPESAFNLISFKSVSDAQWLTLPFGPSAFRPTFELATIIMFLVVSLATLVEHLGDLFTISGIVGRDFYKDPGAHKTILGDGLATAAAGLLGSVPNVSYGECSATQALSKVHSVRVMLAAAIIAIILSFFGKISAIVGTIPAPVLNGACFTLYGLIASSGLRNLVKAGVDYDDNRNLLISSVILTSGIGGALLQFAIGGTQFTLQGMAFGTVLGIILQLTLPKSKS